MWIKEAIVVKTMDMEVTDAADEDDRETLIPTPRGGASLPHIPFGRVNFDDSTRDITAPSPSLHAISLKRLFSRHSATRLRLL